MQDVADQFQLQHVTRGSFERAQLLAKRDCAHGCERVYKAYTTHQPQKSPEPIGYRMTGLHKENRPHKYVHCVIQ